MAVISDRVEQEVACTAQGFFNFWCTVVANKKFQLSLRLFGAVIVLSCPSSADAQRAISALNSIATALRHLMSWDSIRMHLIGEQDTPAADEYPVACAASAWAVAASGDCRRFRGSKRKVRSHNGKKRKVPAFLNGDDNASEEMFRPGAPADADSSSSSSQSSSPPSDSSSSKDVAEMEHILGKCVHIVFWVAAMTYVQCFVLCLREEGPRAVTALYFGWPAFGNRHFVIGGGGAGGGTPPPHYIHPWVPHPQSPPLGGLGDRLPETSTALEGSEENCPVTIDL